MAGTDCVMAMVAGQNNLVHTEIPLVRFCVSFVESVVLALETAK
jgi:hypothetical protein